MVRRTKEQVKDELLKRAKDKGDPLSGAVKKSEEYLKSAKVRGELMFCDS